MRSDTQIQLFATSDDKSFSTSIFIARRNGLSRMKSRRSQRGFDLIQLGLVVALIGLLMVGALWGVPKLIENIRTGQQSDDIRGFMTQAQAHFPLYKDKEITVPNVHAAALFLGQDSTGSTPADPSYLSRFGGDIKLTTDTSNRLITLTIPDLPNTGVCTKIAAQLSGVAHSVKVGGVTASSSQGRLDMTKVTEACRAVGVPDKDSKTVPVELTVKV